MASAITIADIATRSAEETDQVLNALASWAAIERAKGAIMAVQRCSADQAWAVLRRSSREFNIKLRELAVALIELIGQATTRQPVDVKDKVIVGQPARRAAQSMWQALTLLDDKQRAQGS